MISTTDGMNTKVYETRCGMMHDKRQDNDMIIESVGTLQEVMRLRLGTPWVVIYIATY